MPNLKKCETCEHFDPVLRGQTTLGKMRETSWGWCAKRSLYPAYEGPGQKFPDEVKRAAPGEMAQPYIVRREQVIGACNDHVDRTPRLSKKDLLKKLHDKAGAIT